MSNLIPPIKREEVIKIDDKIVTVAGRINSVRGQGKLMFYDIRGEGAISPKCN